MTVSLPPFDWGAVWVFLGVLATASATWGAAYFTLRAKAQEDKQALIDQLQEERNEERNERRREREEFAAQLAAERAEIAAERAVNSERIDRFWADKAASRTYVAQLEHHIWAQKEPPPPTPPDGYIP